MPTLLLLTLTAAVSGPPDNELGAGPLRYGASALALRDIPPLYLEWYQRAEAAYGVEWALLAAVGKVETDHGRSSAPGVHSGHNSHGCCAGPMLFFTNHAMAGGRTTWDAYGLDGNHDGTINVYDPADAIMAAANYLNALGATTDPRQALFGYNHASWYVDQVETWANKYRGTLTSPTHDVLPPDTGSLTWPVPGPVVSPFGPRCLNGSCRRHEGIDIAVPAGTPVHASADGTITLAAPMSGYGNFLCIIHSPRLTTCYAHLSSYRATRGDTVRRGDVIALSGCTGRCFGDHLHYEVHTAPSWSPQSSTDPARFLGM
jgi:murein DD-endopeptidase MepM/ murein hydrolase activator NlpD